jgi:hypothetical protein
VVLSDRLTKTHLIVAAVLAAGLTVASVAVLGIKQSDQREWQETGSDVGFMDETQVHHPDPAYRYEVAYDEATGEIQQLSSFPKESRWVPLGGPTGNGTAVLDVTDDPNLAPLWDAARDGRLHDWKVDPARREITRR